MEYYFNSSDGYYHPLNEETHNLSTVGDQWNNLLNELGAQKYYSPAELESRSYQNVFRLSCNNLIPTLNFFGIPVFDYKIWLFLMLISIMGWVIYKLHDMS
jgi:hypothetical protein